MRGRRTLRLSAVEEGVSAKMGRRNLGRRATHVLLHLSRLGSSEGGDPELASFCALASGMEESGQASVFQKADQQYASL